MVYVRNGHVRILRKDSISHHGYYDKLHDYFCGEELL